MNDAHRDLLPRELALAFALLHKRGLGVTVGTASGLVIFAATFMYLWRSSTFPFDIELLAQYFFGYRATWWGAFLVATLLSSVWAHEFGLAKDELLDHRLHGLLLFPLLLALVRTRRELLLVVLVVVSAHGCVTSAGAS